MELSLLTPSRLVSPLPLCSKRIRGLKTRLNPNPSLHITLAFKPHSSLKPNCQTSHCFADKSESVQVISIGSKKDAIIDFCFDSPFHLSSSIRFWIMQWKGSSDIQLQERCIVEDLNLRAVEVSEFLQLCPKAFVLVASAGYGLDDTKTIDILKAMRAANGFAFAILLMPFSFEGQRRKDEVKGLMDVFFTPNARKVVENRNLKQTSMNAICNKELRSRVCRDIARFFYDNAISFNAAKSKSFAVMVESIGQFGVGLKPPSYHELRVPLLNKEVDEVKNMMKSYEEEWSKYGCSIMADGWTDKRQRTLINFLVNSPKGTVFIESIDASSYSKTGGRMFDLLNAMVERIGEENVVQVVTDSASNNVLAGKMLEKERKHLFWTPYAAHCVDLILEDIGKIPLVHRTLRRAISLCGFIYVRPGVVDLLRKHTGKLELLRPAVTRFSTAYITLERIQKLKSHLRRMFNSEEWVTSKWTKEAQGKKATSIILMPSFWSSIVYILKVMGPLVRVLRLVDGEKQPAMGYIYEAMDRAKEAIMKSFNENEDKYKDIFKIIDKRWENQLHRPLHAAGYYLNPQFFYSNPKVLEDNEVMNGLHETILKLVRNIDDQDKITQEMTAYQEAENLFGNELVIRNRHKLAPAEWWKRYGSPTPTLRKFAIKVLSLTCSASGCERNWSLFEHVRDLEVKIREHTNFCIRIDTDSLLKKDLVTLDEALRSANSAVLMAINAISVLVSGIEWKKGDVSQKGVKGIKAAEIMQILKGYKEAKIGFGAGKNVKSSISYALHECPFIGEGVQDFNGIVICIIASSALISDEEIYSTLHPFHQSVDRKREIFMSTLIEPNLEPDTVITTIVMLGCTELQAPQRSSIFSRFIQHFPFVFKLLRRDGEHLNNNEGNEVTGATFSNVINSPEFVAEDYRVAVEDVAEGVETQSQLFASESSSGISDLDSSSNCGSEESDIDLLDDEPQSSNFYDENVPEGTHAFQRESLFSWNVGLGYQVAQKWANERTGDTSVIDNVSIFRLPVGVKLSDDLKDSSNMPYAEQFSESKVDSDVQKQKVVNSSRSWSGFYNDASTVLKGRNVGIAKKQGVLSVRAASMLEAERDLPKKWSPVTEMQYRGGVYKGRCQGGLPEGKGCLKLRDGSIYDGMWRYGKRSGPGTFYFSNGDVFQGSWRDDAMHGKGWFYFHTGDRWFANFWKGKANGESRFYSKSGDVYFGQFQDGWRHGPFLCIDVHGLRYLETWDQGILVSRKQLDSDE